ncbi:MULTISPECIES: adenosylcobinamide amidohydrolase [unclassified Leptospira]|uniref:adenosylcobinamide amidohydrolase n=1 Tax=unclassified Leptospira TaxID=2633828 RepID=UPI0002BF8256|nr:MULTISPECIES: adenosylcobinamide amidohydrolase [unclassified Leptospira]EMK01944.1 adenosylcobinamide amidohydrolase [Leptospira sp. B5-022]MCR1795158.1 adenosylcobinamide amidohydrolase [Leptospira sp. id769339]
MSLFQEDQIGVSETWLELQLSKPHSSLSWAVVGGGYLTTNKVYWLKVSNADLSPEIIPEEYYRNRLIEKGEKEEILGFMTSASLFDYSVSEKSMDGLHVRSIATVGLGNAVRVGHFLKQNKKIGTINILVQTSEALTFSASIEAVSIASEARTLAVLESEIRLQNENDLATGTGTDCIGVISPIGPNGIDYVGKHTVFGHLIGASSYEAVTQGILKWKIGKNLSYLRSLHI